LGKYGMIAIALAIALACLTTAIALTSAVGTFFSQLSGGKVGYKTLVTVCCLISGVLAISGVDNIIQFAYPPLAFVYPIVITLVLYVVFFGQRITSKTPYIGALMASTLVAVLSLFKILNLWSESTLDLLNKIPFFSIDLGWVVPSAVGFIIGLWIDKSRSNKLQALSCVRISVSCHKCLGQLYFQYSLMCMDRCHQFVRQREKEFRAVHINRGDKLLRHFLHMGDRTQFAVIMINDKVPY